MASFEFLEHIVEAAKARALALKPKVDSAFATARGWEVQYANGTQELLVSFKGLADLLGLENSKPVEAVVETVQVAADAAVTVEAATAAAQDAVAKVEEAVTTEADATANADDAQETPAEIASDETAPAAETAAQKKARRAAAKAAAEAAKTE